MRVVFRADASSIIGSGHVMRCLTLAEKLRAVGAEVLFVCREHAGHLCDLIEARDFAVGRLPAPRSPGVPADYSSWVGTTQETDAAETLAAVAAAGFSGVDGVVVDHYGLDATWEGAMRPAALWLLAIDDVANRRHATDLLLDQNLVAEWQTRYDALLSPGTRRLLGPVFALLQPQYAAAREHLQHRSVPPRRFLVYFGGADRQDLAGKTVAAFLALGSADLCLDVVVGVGYERREQLGRLVHGHANVAIHDQLPSLAGLMSGADVAIGGGGATSWERLCLKLPALVVTLADNQRPIVSELERRGVVRWLGDADAVGEAQLASALAAALASPLQPEFGADLAVDGRGADRVVDAITEMERA